VVAEASLTGLKVTPMAPHLHLGEQIGLQATASYADGTTEEVTDRVLWTSSDPKVAAVQSEFGFLITVGPGTCTVTAHYTGVQDSVVVTVEPGHPQRLVLSPTSLILAPDEHEQLQAILLYDDGTSRDVSDGTGWGSSSPEVAELDGGTVSAHAVGSATLTAEYGSFRATATLKVTAARPKALVITPSPAVTATGQRLQLTAMAQLDDGTSRDVTNQATWVSSLPDVALVSSGAGGRGQLSASQSGTVTVTANYLSQHASVMVTVLVP
jgi:uncharacterized protein YjdB